MFSLNYLDVLQLYKTRLCLSLVSDGQQLSLNKQTKSFCVDGLRWVEMCRHSV